MAKYNFLVQTGMKKIPGHSRGAAAARSRQTEEQRQIFDFISKAVVIARPFVTNAGVPPERVEACARLRRDLEDPDFLAEAKKLNLEIDPTSGEDCSRPCSTCSNFAGGFEAESHEAIEIKSAAEAAKGIKARRGGD